MSFVERLSLPWRVLFSKIALFPDQGSKKDRLRAKVTITNDFDCYILVLTSHEESKLSISFTMGRIPESTKWHFKVLVVSYIVICTCN